VTSLASSDEEDGLEPSQRYCVPRHVTPAGRRAFHEVMRGWAAQLAEQMEIDAQRSRQVDPEYTAIQVHDARRAVERQNALRVEQDRSDRRVLAAIMLAVGSLGITVLSNFLVGPLQVLAFVVSVTVLVAGLILTWTGRARTPRGEP
jgi:Flp pilus assembly protein TadB